MSKTKDKILLQALYLFSQNGYDSVSIRDIVEKVGISKGAIYKHFKNKEDIFLQIVKKMQENDRNISNDFSMPEENKSENDKNYNDLKLDDFINFSKSMYYYWTRDEFASYFRKILMLEQFKNEDMKKLYRDYLLDGPLSYTCDIFESMGISDYKNLAREFYGQIFLFFSLYDILDDKDKVDYEFDVFIEKFTKKGEFYER